MINNKYKARSATIAERAFFLTITGLSFLFQICKVLTPFYLSLGINEVNE